jgi:hypothetical protein
VAGCSCETPTRACDASSADAEMRPGPADLLALPACGTTRVSPADLWAATEVWGPVLSDAEVTDANDFRHDPPAWVAMSGPRGPAGPAGSLAAILLSVSMTWGLSTIANDDASSHGQLLTIGAAYPP